ncbi:MAG: DUF3857 domain-containing protein, partial [Acidobacteriota bacterium]|nr:DUF3857 domain-containing protein [Acidobacteriota bacterium]
MMRKSNFLAAAILMLSVLPVLTRAAGDEAPAWLQGAAGQVAPSYPKDVPAVVLLDEGQMRIDTDGKLTTTTTYAVRILTREGRVFAQAAAPYETDTGGKVRELKAWLIRAGGQVKKYGKDETADIAADINDVYNEARVKIISARDDADAGSVFGYQIVTEERALFPHTSWAFQERIPVLLSRVSLALPEKWSASSLTFNHPLKLEPAVSGTTYTWELRNLPPIEPEVASPNVSSLAPRLVVNYNSPDGGASVMGRAFKDWSDVSRWYTELSAPQAAPDEAIATKVRELTAGARTELERIQVIGHFVQNLQYISIQIGVG